MEYSPREIVAALRAEMLHRVLESNTVWLCTSCYSCTVRCPAGIPFTDVMYELKRLEAQKGLRSEKDPAAVMAKVLVESVNRHGRNHEPEVIRKFYWRTKPSRIFGQMRLAWRLMRRGRLAFLSHDIRGLPDLQKMLAAIEEDGAA